MSQKNKNYKFVLFLLPKNQNKMNIKKSEHEWVIVITAKGERIVTMDEMKEHAWYDSKKHLILEEIHKTWDWQQKWPNWEPTVLQLHSNSLKLKHIYNEIQRDIIDAINWYNQPSWEFTKKIDPVTWKMWALYLADAHIGKLDIKWTSLLKQVKMISKSVREALTKLEDQWVDEYLIARLGDNVNTDFKWKTTKWTEQENNSNDRDMYKAFIDLDTDIIDQTSQLGKTTVRHIPGNHDEERTFYIDHFIKHHFANNPNVEVVWDAESAQYHKFGKVGIMMHHGDKLNDRDVLGLSHKNIHNVKILESHSGHHHTDSIMDLKWIKAYKHPSLWGKNSWAKSVNVWQDYGQFNSVVYDKDDWREANFINRVK